MRFLGLVLALVGLAASYFLGYKGMTIDQARSRLATLSNIPGLAPAPNSGTANVSGTMAASTSGAPAAGLLTGPGPGGLGFTGRGRQT